MTKMFQNRTAKFLNFLFNALWYVYLFFSIVITTLFIVMLVFSIAGKPLDININSTVSLTEKAANTIQLKKDLRMHVSLGEVNHSIKYYTNFHGLHTWYLIVFFILMYGLIVGVLFILYFFKKIFNQLMDDQVFTLENIERIRYIGIIFICLWAAAWILATMNSIYFQKYIIQEGNYQFVTDAHFEILLPGLIALILSQVFRYGYQLQNDKDLTI